MYVEYPSVATTKIVWLPEETSLIVIELEVPLCATLSKYQLHEVMSVPECAQVAVIVVPLTLTVSVMSVALGFVIEDSEEAGSCE